MRANILDRRGFAMVVGRAVGGALFAAFLTVSTPAGAQSAAATGPGAVTAKDVFVAFAVPVDVTAATVTEARERGLTQGRVDGFRKVIERVVAREDLNRVPQLSSTQIIDMVRDFSIENERNSAVRYLADLTVRFDPNVIRRLLRSNNVPFTETLSKPVVVVPLLRDSSGARWTLWGDDNAWRAAWSQVPKDSGLVPLIVPAGDRDDAAALATEQAAAKDLAGLNALAARYGADGSIIAMATFSGDTAQIALSELRNDLPSEDLSVTQSAEPGQSRQDVLAAAARAAASALQDSWKRRNRVAFGGTTQITALVQVSDLKEWITVRKHLEDVQLIDNVELLAMTRDRVQVTLHYAGAQRQLDLAMSQQDLSLSQQNGVWIIQARGVPAASRVLTKPGTPAAEAQ